jgi:hypothetical protein
MNKFTQISLTLTIILSSYTVYGGDDQPTTPTNNQNKKDNLTKFFRGIFHHPHNKHNNRRPQASERQTISAETPKIRKKKQPRVNPNLATAQEPCFLNEGTKELPVLRQNSSLLAAYHNKNKHHSSSPLKNRHKHFKHHLSDNQSFKDFRDSLNNFELSNHDPNYDSIQDRMIKRLSNNAEKSQQKIIIKNKTGQDIHVSYISHNKLNKHIEKDFKETPSFNEDLSTNTYTTSQQILENSQVIGEDGQTTFTRPSTFYSYIVGLPSASDTVHDFLGVAQSFLNEGPTPESVVDAVSLIFKKAKPGRCRVDLFNGSNISVKFIENPRTNTISCRCERTHETVKTHGNKTANKVCKEF